VPSTPPLLAGGCAIPLHRGLAFRFTHAKSVLKHSFQGVELVLTHLLLASHYEGMKTPTLDL
jgi:hypothetical protein